MGLNMKRNHLLSISLLILVGLFSVNIALAGSVYSEKEKEQAKNLIVKINTKFSDEDIGFCAGIIFGYKNKRLYIATAKHSLLLGKKLIEKEKLLVQFRFLAGEKISVSNLEPTEIDLAILTIDLEKNTVPVKNYIKKKYLIFDKKGTTKNLKPGDNVYAIGHPHGNNWDISPEPDKVKEVCTDRIIFKSDSVAVGNSGGGLFDEKLKLIGMVNLTRGLNAEAIPIEVLCEIIKKKNYPIDCKTVIDIPPSAWIAAGGGVLLVAGGLALIDDEDGDNGGGPSITIDSPSEGSQVSWINIVQGHSTGFAADDYVVISIQPHNYGWFEQSSIGKINADGKWVANNCYFGLEGDIDKGRAFRIKASLRDRNGNEKATDFVDTVIRN